MLLRSHLCIQAVQRVDSGDGGDGGDARVGGYLPVVVTELVLVTAAAEAAASAAVRTGTGIPVSWFSGFAQICYL